MKRVSLFILIFLVISIPTSFAQRSKSYSSYKPSKSSSGRIQYPGSKHKESHDGKYVGGRGSSHKGGTYVNSKTNNAYGKHKK